MKVLKQISKTTFEQYDEDYEKERANQLPSFLLTEELNEPFYTFNAEKNKVLLHAAQTSSVELFAATRGAEDLPASWADIEVGCSWCHIGLWGEKKIDIK